MAKTTNPQPAKPQPQPQPQKNWPSKEKDKPSGPDRTNNPPKPKK